MCIAIASPAAANNNGLIITKKTLERCFDGNPDGAGFAYGQDGKVVIEKGFFSFPEFYEAFKPHEEKQCLIHFRIKTHGAKSKEMCHPFLVNDHIAMIHNGVISGHGKGDVSDTAEFVSDLIVPMVSKHGDDVLKDAAFQKIVEKYIGYSKLMFLNTLTDEFLVYNQGMCNENCGIVFSNFSWQEPVKFPTLPHHTTDYADWWKRSTEDSLQKKNKMLAGIRTELPYLTRATYGRAMRFEKGDFIRIEGLASSDECVKGDICLIERIWNDGKVDVYNFTQERSVEGVASWRCDEPTEADLRMISQ